MKRLYILIFLLTNAFYSVLSQGTMPAEQINLFTNADILLTGETLYFKLYCQSGTTTAILSKIAYIEVIGEDTSPVLSAKVSLTNGEGNGEFFLPSKMATGHYTIVAYTRWMKNFDMSSFFTKEITVINPFRIQTQANFNSTLAPLPEQSAKSNESVLITSNKQIYQPREKISLSVDLKSAESSGSFAIGVHMDDHLSSVESPGEAPRKQSPNSEKYLPELRGKLITGSATSVHSNLPFAGKLLFLSASGKEYYFHATRTGQDGKFNFVLEQPPVGGQLIIQSDKGDTTKVKIVLDNDFLSDYTPFKPKPFTFNQSIVKMVEKRSLYAQIENSYYQRKQDSITRSYAGRFYIKPDKTYDLDAYTRFPTMEDVFREYVNEVIVRKKAESFELAVMDGKTRLPFNGLPAILLDGILISNTKAVMDYDPNLLKRIEIVTRRYFLGPAVMYGIVSLETYQGDAKSLYIRPEHVFSFEGIQPSKKYYQPDYINRSKELQRIPDYRVQLAWNPDAILTGKKATFEFFASDVPGKYEVTIQGLGNDHKPIRGSYTFSVKAP